MMNDYHKQAIINCRKSVSWFLKNFGKLKHPSAGILPFNPFSYQRLAIKAFRSHKYNIFRKCRQCFAGKSLVWTPRGPIPISNIQAGDEVLSYDYNTKTVVITKVVNKYNNGRRRVYRITTSNGHESYPTHDHLYYTADHKEIKAIDSFGVKLLSVNDIPKYNSKTEYTELLAYFIRDYRDNRLYNTDYKELYKVQKLIDKLFDSFIPINISRDDLGYYMDVGDNIANWYESARDMEHVFGLNDNDLADFLRICLANRWVTLNNAIVSGPNDILAKIRQLLSRFNICAHINKNELRMKTNSSYYRLFGGDANIDSICTNNCVVNSIVDVGYDEVYDIEVPPYNNYIVDGVVVHNSGISKISGAFATWYAMFHPHKTILIVSRTDDDAMNFMSEHIWFLFSHLPEWMQELWDPVKKNEHEIVFPNGSKIKSLTSNVDVLRSNASSLNIIDEAAFIRNMDMMWASGWPTLQHGGNVIVISTTNGSAGWYWSTMTAAEAGTNQFNPIVVNWWDMDWAIEYYDELSGNKVRIAPRDGIRKCRTPEEIEKYGPYWSPWLEEQYKALEDKGESWKFDQEILARFVGSGNTVLPKRALMYISTTIREPEPPEGMIITGDQTYYNPHTGETEILSFDFAGPDEGFWIWKKPRKGHIYVMGVDTATGKGKDYHGIEVFDVIEMEQVAELMAHCLPRELVRYVDSIGRYYNYPLTVIERNNGGDIIIDQLRIDYQYPTLWRQKTINDRPSRGVLKHQRLPKVKPYGFATSVASKPILNKFLIDYLGPDGYKIYSRRLLKQLQIYVRKRDRAGRDTNKTEAEEGVGNFDDLVMACALALRAIPDSSEQDTVLQPFVASQFTENNIIRSPEEIATKGGIGSLMPVVIQSEYSQELNPEAELSKFMTQISGGVPLNPQDMPIINAQKHLLNKRR